MKENTIILIIVILITSIFVCTSALLMKFEKIGDELESPKSSIVTIATDSAVISGMQEIATSIESLQEWILHAVEEMQKATDIQVKASNQSFAATQSFIQWAIDNGYLKEE